MVLEKKILSSVFVLPSLVKECINQNRGWSYNFIILHCYPYFVFFGGKLAEKGTLGKVAYNVR